MSEPIIDEAPYYDETGKLFPPGVTTRAEAERHEILEKSLGIAHMIQEDLAAEAKALDATPFTARHIGMTFGTLMAEVSALAKIVQLMLEREQEKP